MEFVSLISLIMITLQVFFLVKTYFVLRKSYKRNPTISLLSSFTLQDNDPIANVIELAAYTCSNFEANPDKPNICPTRLVLLQGIKELMFIVHSSPQFKNMASEDWGKFCLYSTAIEKLKPHITELIKSCEQELNEK